MRTVKQRSTHVYMRVVKIARTVPYEQKNALALQRSSFRENSTYTCALLKLPVPYEQKNALALQRSSFRENSTYFLSSVCRWVCELVFDAIYDWRSEFTHNRQNEKALKCKPSALIFGRGCAKEFFACAR